MIVNAPNTTAFWHRLSSIVRDPHAGLYLVRKTSYDAYRVYNVKTQAWEGNAFEDETGAKALARRLERGA